MVSITDALEREILESRNTESVKSKKKDLSRVLYYDGKCPHSAVFGGCMITLR